MERQEYINRIGERLQVMLENESRLPCKFVIDGSSWPQTDGPISIYLRPVTAYEGIFEGNEIFKGLNQRLNDEFSSEKLYFGIFVYTPHQFLGQDHIKQVEADARQKAEDIQKYRCVRLNDAGSEQADSARDY